MCEFFGVSRAAYYDWLRRQTEPDPEAERMQWVQEVWLQSRQTYGYRRITIKLQQQGRNMNHKAVLRLMNKLGIQSIARPRKACQPVTAGGGSHRYPNILERNFTATEPNQKWVTDVTYIHTQTGWAYLSAIKDLFDGFIVAYQFDTQHSVELVTRTLQQAKQKEGVTDGLVLHSDQGSPYVSQDYACLTQQYSITPSMSRAGTPLDNAPIESFFACFKQEALRLVKNPTLYEARCLIEDYIAFYNFERIQLKTKQTPYERRCLFS
jgi:putative transposase